MTTILPGTRPDTTDPELLPELDTVLGHLPQWVADHGLTLLTGLPQGSSLVHSLSPAAMSAPDFVALAVRTGAPILYVEPELCDAVDTDDEEFIGFASRLDRRDRNRLAALMERAAAEVGRCQGLTLNFVAAGVLHSWRADAVWAEELGDEFAQMEEKYQDPQETKAAREDPRPTPEEADRIADLLQDLSAFRAATRNPERERIVLREHPHLQSVRRTGLSWLGHDAMTEATLRVDDAAKKIYADFTADLPQLADRLLKSGQLDPAANAATRRMAIRTFVQEHSGGYPPSRDFVELLYGQPSLRKIPPSRQATMWGDQ